MRQAVYILLTVIVAATLGGLWVHGRDRDSAAQDRIALLAHRVKATDTLYRHDTLFFNRVLRVAVAKEDTVLKHLTDTVIVKQFIGLQDSVIRACSAVVLTCEQRVAQRDSIIAIYKSLKPSRFSIGVIGGCGYGVKGADCLVGLGASVRVW